MVNVINRDAGSLQHYLIEISRIPLLTPPEEITLTTRLDKHRKRLYRGILATGHGLQAIVTLLRPVCLGTTRLNHVVELPRSGASETRRMLKYLQSAVGVLQSLLAKNQTDFVLTMEKGQPVHLRRLAARRLIARCAKAIRLLEGITIRRQHLMPILEAIRQISQRLDNLGSEVRKTRANPHKRGCVTELQKELFQLAVYPVLVSSPSLLPAQWLTLDAALSSGVLTITDRRTRTTPVSWVENSSLDEYVFLMKDEMIRRGVHTRIVRRDTVLSPGERIELNVLCTQLPPSAGGKPLPASRAILPPLLPETSRSPHQVERRFDSRRKMALGAEYPSDNVEPAPKSKPIDERLEQQCREIVPRIPRGTTGFIFICDGQSLGADFFGSEDMALKLLPKLLKSYALDHVSAPNTANDRGNGRNDTEATEFFERICSTRSEATSTTGSGIGLRTNDRGLLGDGVALDGLVVHYGIRVQELGTPYSRPRPSIIWPRSEMHRQRP